MNNNLPKKGYLMLPDEKDAKGLPDVKVGCPSIHDAIEASLVLQKTKTNENTGLQD